MEETNKAWVRITCAGGEYYGRITIVPPTSEIPLVERVRETVQSWTGGPKIILEYPHLLMRTQTAEGAVQVTPMSVYAPDAKPEFKSMILDASKIDTVIPVEIDVGVARAIRESEGLVSKIIIPAPGVSNMVDFKTIPGGQK